jgi:hypothetical protein
MHAEGQTKKLVKRQLWDRLRIRVQPIRLDTRPRKGFSNDLS